MLKAVKDIYIYSIVEETLQIKLKLEFADMTDVTILPVKSLYL